MAKFAELLFVVAARLLPGSAMIVIVSLGCATGLFAQSNPSPPRAPAAGRMLRQLQQTDWILRAGALQYLAKHQVKAASEPIRKILADTTTPPWLRGRALVAIARVDGPAALDQVLRFAKHVDPALRGAAADAMQQLDAKQIKPSLGLLLKDSVPEVRYRALASHAKHHGAKAWPLVDSMTQSLDAGVHEWGIRALAFVGDDAALARLTTAAKSDERITKTLRGIQGVSNPKLIGLLLQILTGLDPADKRFAAGLTALQQFNRADVLNTLKSELQSGDVGTIRTVALITTLLMPAPELGDPLRRAASDLDDRKTIKTVLVALGPGPMKPDRHRDLFVKYLDHDDAEIRALAIRCLAHCRNVNFYEKLRPSVADVSPAVIQAALGALRRAPVVDAPKGQLVAYLKSPLASADGDVRTMAYDLLAHAGTAADFQPAVTLLGDRLRSTDETVRSEAAAALGGFAPADQIESVVTAQGYVARWMILGTFLNDKDNAGFATVYPPEKGIDFAAKYPAKYIWALGRNRGKKGGELERIIRWGKATVDQTNGQLVIPPLVPPPAALAVAYAVADFRVDADRQVLLTVDGDDAFRVMLNGKKVAEQVAEYQGGQPSVAEQKDIEITLKAGLNRFLVKTTNIDGAWWVRLRLTDSEGRPVEVSAAAGSTLRVKP